MKRHVSALLVIVLVIFSTAAMAQETPWKPKARGQSDKGQWIVEVHKENPEIKQVSFYTKENILMYKEEIKTTKLNVDKEKGWLGTGMDDLYEHRIALTPINQQFYFKKAGTYTFSLEHVMREEPLEHVMNVGLRIEKKAP